MKATGVVVVAVWGLACATSCGSSSHAVAPKATPSPTVAPQVIGGTLVLNTSSSDANSDGACFGTGGYADITAGAQVTLYNEAGTILGTAQLKPGDLKSLNECDFSFSFDPIPPTAKFLLCASREPREDHRQRH